MKNKIRWLVWLGWATLFCCSLFAISAHAEGQTEQDEAALIQPGTYFTTIKGAEKSLERTIRVTIVSPYTIINQEKELAIDAEDIEYAADTELDQLSETQLIRLANAHLWDLRDGHSLPIDEVAITELDSIESELTFASKQTGLSVMIHAFKSGDEIFDRKEYANIKGDMQERDWQISYRTLFTIFSFVLFAGPAALVVTLIIILSQQITILNGLVKPKDRKRLRRFWFMVPLLLSAMLGLNSAYAEEVHSEHIILSQEEFVRLKNENQLAAYLREAVGSQDGAVDIDQLVKAAEKTTDQKEEDYQSKNLKKGEHAAAIPYAVIVYGLLIAIPLAYLIYSYRQT